MESFALWLESDLHALFSSIRGNIFDTLPMLVACDWLDEHGEENLANAMRTLINLSQKQDGDPKEIYRAISNAKTELNDISRNSRAMLTSYSANTNSPNVIFDDKIYRWNAATDAFSVQDPPGESGLSFPRKLKKGETIPDEVIKVFLAWRANFWIDHGQFVQGSSGVDPGYDDDEPIYNKQIKAMLGNLFVRHEDNIDEFVEGIRPFSAVRNFLLELDRLVSKLGSPIHYPELQEALQQIREHAPDEWLDMINKALTKIGGL